MQTLEQLCREIKNLRNNGNSWRDVGRIYGVTPSMARLISMGYEPGKKVRVQLKLPALIPAPACPKCGDVHVTHRCTKNKPLKRPRIDPAWGEGWRRWESWKSAGEAAMI